MTQFAAYPDEDLFNRPMRRPTRRASTSVWALRMATTCVGLASLAMLASLAWGWMSDSGEMEGRTTDPVPVTLTLGNERLSIPQNMLRFDDQRTPGPHERVDIAVHWPDLAGYTAANRADFLDTGADAPIIYLSIRTRDTATDSAGRLISVYQHFFDPGTLPAPDGLVGHRLSAESGLGGEEVYFEAGSTEPFTTHCTAADGTDTPTTCLTEVHAGRNLSVQIRFRKGMLDKWNGIKSGVRVLLLSYGVTS